MATKAEKHKRAGRPVGAAGKRRSSTRRSFYASRSASRERGPSCGTGRCPQPRGDPARVSTRHRRHQILPRADDLLGEPESDQRGARLPASPKPRLELHRAPSRSSSARTGNRRDGSFRLSANTGRPNVRAAVRAGRYRWREFALRAPVVHERTRAPRRPRADYPTARGALVFGNDTALHRNLPGPRA
jgi:hypothetical protein